jgi:hypothetical protein
MVQRIITVSFHQRPLVFREILRAQREEDIKPPLGPSTLTYHIMLIPNIFCVAIRGRELKLCIGSPGGPFAPASSQFRLSWVDPA